MADGAAAKKVVLIDQSKKETHHAGTGFKKFCRRLRSAHKIVANKDELSSERLDPRVVACVVLGAPRERFLPAELDALKGYVAAGGSIAVFAGEGGDAQRGSNVNQLLEEYGISVHADSVVRTVYFKYLHPKECYIANGIVHPEIAEKKKAVSTSKGKAAAADEKKAGGKAGAGGAVDTSAHGGLAFVYPYGASMTVSRPAHAVLSSGPISYPLNRPIGAVYEAATAEKAKPAAAAAGGADSAGGSADDGAGGAPTGLRGRVLALGSVEVFGDDYLDKDENAALADVLFAWLLRSDDVTTLHEPPPITETSASENTVESETWAEYTRVPNTEALADRIRACLQENEELPKDFTKLFNDQLFRFDTDLIPEAVALYEQLGVKHENLSLIPPEFECPQPPLAPAVFPPQLRELPPPALDQFDLDEHFASSRQRLAQLTNKCTSNEDLDYYIKEAGEILNVTGQLAAKSNNSKPSAKDVLHFIFSELVRFKKVNMDPVPGAAASADAGGGALGGDDGPVMSNGGGEMMVFDNGPEEPMARGGGSLFTSDSKGEEMKGGDFKGGDDMKVADMDGGGEVMTFHK